MADHYSTLNTIRREIARLKQRPSSEHYSIPDANLQRLHGALAASQKLNASPGPALRRWVPKFLWPFFRNQGSINRSYWDALKALADEMDLLRLEIARLHEDCNSSKAHISEHQAHLSSLNEAREQQQKINAALKKQANPLEGLEAGHFYLDFENSFRGEGGVVSERQRNYVAYADEVAAALLSRSRFKKRSDIPVLDIGCGRGEWLQILQNNGYSSAVGIEINRAMVDHCSSKGIKTIQAEALSYLKEQERDSVGLITAFHIVEHLPFSTLADFFKESLRVLHPGGMLMIETPNPENLRVGAFTFYYDPTHRHPLPCRTLKFLAEWVGYGDCRELYLNPYSLFSVLGVQTAIPLPPEMCHGDYALLIKK